MVKKRKSKYIKKKKSGLPTLLMGWIFIIVSLFGITIMILNAKPSPKLVCDYSKRASLNQFGTCRVVR